MLRYPTPSDQRYGDACNPVMPQGSTYWAPGRPDPHPSAVTRDSDDRHGTPRLRSNQTTSSNYPPVTPNSVPPSDSYPTQTQGDYSGQRGYPAQQYVSSVNYAAPPYDFAAYPVSYPSTSLTEHSPSPLQMVPDSVYQGGQYPQTRYECPPSDATSFHQSLYDPGYFTSDGQRSSPLDGQHQQSLMSNTSGFLRYDDSLDYYDHFTQHPIASIPPSSTSSELGNALMEIPSSESQQQHMSRSSIALPTLPTPPHSVPKREPSEAVVGLNPVKNEYGTTTSGQPFSPMIPLDTLLPGGHAPYPKEESQEQLHVGSSSMPRPATPLHGHDPPHHRQQTQDSFRMVQDPAAYPEFAPAPKVRSCLDSRTLSHTHPSAEAPAIPFYTCPTSLFPWCAYLDAIVILVLVVRCWDANIGDAPPRLGVFAVVSHTINNGSESQGWTTGVKVAVHKTNCAAQTSYCLPILP
jgi:hypothetical protein